MSLAVELDYQVTPGRYQGVSGSIGYDGIWGSPENHALIVEVKTTDAYRISLDTLASYRERLIAAHEIGASSSILIVVGRQDTGELEAQIRGSRHAWDVRLISAEALLKLVRLKQTAEGAGTGRKIRSLLIPAEYTRLDGMVDVMFTAAKDVEEGAVEVAESEQDKEAAEVVGPSDGKSGWQFTDSALLQRKREALVAALGRRYRVDLIKETRALCGDIGNTIRLASTISKRYPRKANPYWFAYHPNWDVYLAGAASGFLVLGCMDMQFGFAIPLTTVRSVLPFLNITVRPDGETYWHMQLIEEAGQLCLLLPKRQQNLPLEDCKFNLDGE